MGWTPQVRRGRYVADSSARCPISKYDLCITSAPFPFRLVQRGLSPIQRHVGPMPPTIGNECGKPDAAPSFGRSTALSQDACSRMPGFSSVGRSLEPKYARQGNGGRDIPPCPSPRGLRWPLDIPFPWRQVGSRSIAPRAKRQRRCSRDGKFSEPSSVLSDETF
jgi:hypothetical protein